MDEDYALFARIVETGSLTGAGRKMRLSPAMVSKRLARLEQRLGTRLIYRTTRRLSTTDVGQAFYEDVAAILAASRAAEAKVAGRADAPAGRLRVSAPTSFGRMHIAPFVAGFIERYPALNLELLLTDDFADIMRDRIDVAIRITNQIDAGFSSDLLAPNHRILCAAPSYLEKRGEPKRLEDLSKHHLLAASNQTHWRLQSARGHKTKDVDSRVATNSSEVIRELAIGGLGVALRSSWDIFNELKAGVLVRILPEWSGATDVRLYAVRPSAPWPPVNVRALIQYLKDVYGETPYWDAPTPRKARRS
jgi:DNA-binding transcriptional LysR family regulator